MAGVAREVEARPVAAGGPEAERVRHPHVPAGGLTAGLPYRGGASAAESCSAIAISAATVAGNSTALEVGAIVDVVATRGSGSCAY